MPAVFVVVGSAAIAAAFLTLAWTLQRRRGCDVPSDSDEDAVVAMLPPT